jgi:Glycogen recognition site of AMP-activated protein kinase
MNPQTISTRTNAKHFGQAGSRETISPKSSKTKLAAAEALDHKVPQENSAGKDGAVSKPGNNGVAAAHHEASAAEREIQFRLEAPTAQEVLLAADFTNWDKNPVKLIKGGGGVWHAKLSLTPGRHLYRFLVDGVWQDDPHGKERVPNPYGSANSVVEVH